MEVIQEKLAIVTVHCRNLFIPYLKAELDLLSVQITDAAVEIFELAMINQIKDDIISDPSVLCSFLSKQMAIDVAKIFQLKYNVPRLTSNRMIRLLGDMHDSWIKFRD